jgi:hypothetical protein
MSFTTLLDPAYDDALTALEECERHKARAFAAEATVLARLAARTTRTGWQGEAPFESLLLDVAGTCLVGQQSAGARLLDAEHLVGRLPGLLAALAAGRVFVAQARVLIGETRNLDPQACAAVQERVLPDAERLAPGPLRAKVKAVVLAVDAQEAARRAAQGRTDRRVWSRPAEDGTALLMALGPAAQIRALELDLTRQAAAARAAGDPRTADQLRFDLLCERAAGGAAGPGPLPAVQVRELLTDAELRKVCVDRRTGRTVAVEPRVARPAGDVAALRQALLAMVTTPTVAVDRPEPRHDPSAPLARLVRTRDVACDGPGCSVPAARCELDHQIPWPTGPTSAGNLRARSQRCHHAKHHGWQVSTDDTTSRWTSPGGRNYLVHHRNLPPPTPDRPLPTPTELAAHDRQRLTPDE